MAKSPKNRALQDKKNQEAQDLADNPSGSADPNAGHPNYVGDGKNMRLEFGESTQNNENVDVDDEIDKISLQPRQNPTGRPGSKVPPTPTPTPDPTPGPTPGPTPNTYKEAFQSAFGSPGAPGTPLPGGTAAATGIGQGAGGGAVTGILAGGSIGNIAGGAIGGYFGGPIGSAIGSKVGGAAQQGIESIGTPKAESHLDISAYAPAPVAGSGAGTNSGGSNGEEMLKIMRSISRGVTSIVSDGVKTILRPQGVTGPGGKV